jgi:hypothetical protein
VAILAKSFQKLVRGIPRIITVSQMVDVESSVLPAANAAFPLITLENSKPLPLPAWILELLGVLFLWGHFRAWRAIV